MKKFLIGLLALGSVTVLASFPTLKDYRKCWNGTLGHGVFFVTGKYGVDRGVYLLNNDHAYFQKLNSVRQYDIAYQLPEELQEECSTTCFLYDGRNPNPSYTRTDWEFGIYELETLVNIFHIESRNILGFSTNKKILTVESDLAEALNSRILYELSFPDAPKDKKSCLDLIN